MEQTMRKHNADAPTFYVPDHAALTRLHKIVVPDFRMRSAVGQPA
jgi:hypothetical protein